jgi:hypothetical protein
MEQAYHKAVNTACIQVATGASDYMSAVRRHVESLAADGLQVIDCASGRKDQLDVAVRRAAITGLTNTMQKSA